MPRNASVGQLRQVSQIPRVDNLPSTMNNSWVMRMLCNKVIWHFHSTLRTRLPLSVACMHACLLACRTWPHGCCCPCLVAKCLRGTGNRCQKGTSVTDSSIPTQPKKLTIRTCENKSWPILALRMVTHPMPMVALLRSIQGQALLAELCTHSTS